MRKRRLRAALLGTVSLALVGIGYLVWRTLHAVRVPAELVADLLPEAAQYIRDFRRVKVKDGRTVWEITAQDARFFDKEGEVVVTEPRVTLFLEDGGRTARVSGTEGRLTLDDRELRTLTLDGGVTVKIDDLEIKTASATYDHARDLITAPGDVSIHDGTLDVRGTGLEMSVTPQQLRLLGDVRTVVRSDAEES